MMVYITCLFFLHVVSSNVMNDFVLDYFNYKRTASVVGFSCNSFGDDISLIKSFNKMNVTVALAKFNYKRRIKYLTRTIYKKIGIFLDSRCYSVDDISSIFAEATEYRVYDDLHSWIILGSSVSNVTSFLNDSTFGYSTDLVIAVPMNISEPSGYHLFDVYNIWKDRGTKLNVTFMGSWSERDRKINVVFTATRYQMRADLQGSTLNVSFYINFENKTKKLSVEEYLQDYSRITSDNISKFGYIMISHLSDMFNFKMQCNKAPEWKSDNPVGATVHSVFKNENDMTGTPSIMTLRRLNFIKYTYQSWPFRTCFICRSPQPKNIKINEILGPFEIDVWCTFVMIFVLSVCTLVLVSQFESSENSVISSSDAFLSTVGAFSLQGMEVQMQFAATRIASFFLISFGYLLNNYYSSVIVSIRLNEPIFKLNDSLVTLAKTDMKVSSEWLLYFKYYTKQTDYESRTFFASKWSKMPDDEKWMEPSKALPLVAQGGYAYHVVPEVAYQYVYRYFEMREICEMTEIHLQRPTSLSFGISQNSTISEVYRIGLSRMAEVGLRKRNVIRWTTQRPVCDTATLSPSGIDIYEFSPHLILLGVGTGISIVVLLVEIFKKKFLQRLN